MGAFLSLLVVCPLAGAAKPVPGPASPRIVYGGDAAFPPYEYIDAQGVPRGFNIDLMRLLAEQTGARLEFRLSRWNEAVAGLESGAIDVMSLAYSAPRGARFDFLAQTWTLRRGFLMRPGRQRYPSTLEELSGEVVACEERGGIHDALLALPAARRPTIRLAANHLEVCRMLQRGEVTAAVGNSLTLRYFADQIGLSDVIDVEFGEHPYHLVTRKGRGAELQFLSEAFERVRDTNAYHSVVERSLVLPDQPRSWLDYWKPFTALGAALVALAVGSVAWNRSLRNKVVDQTQALEGTIREKARLTTALHVTESRFRAMIEGLNLAVAQHGPDGAITFANPAAQAILGLTARELLGRRSLDPAGAPVREDGAPLAPDGEPPLAALSSGEPVRDFVMGVTRRGERAWLQVTAQPEKDERGAVVEVLTTFSDVSERKRSEEQIHYLAYHDSLTGLPNRELFLDRLSVALAHAQRNQLGLAIVFIDLDQFKVINDSLGHSVGDEVLRQTGGRIRAALRDEDTVARLGGDEFTALLVDVELADEAARVVEKLQQAIKRPLRLDERELEISASIGVALYPSDGPSAESLLKNADTAMYRAKELGRDQYQFYTASMGALLMKHIDLEARLRRTLAAGGLRLHYQPFVDLQTGAVEGIEALVRWEDPERGMIPPDEFIPLAEVTGLIGEISTFVLRTACAEHPLITQAPPLTVAVNLSARQFQRGEVVELVRRTLDETRLDPRRLALEITETMAMQDHALTVETLKRLKALGVKISIDDFGTGYSSLAYLRRFPIDTLKVDRSFVHDISTDASAAGIVGAIIALARELGLRVVAEGVETREQLVFLRRQGCHAAQGYLFARPRPIADLAAAVENVSSLFSELDTGSRQAGAAS